MTEYKELLEMAAREVERLTRERDAARALVRSAYLEGWSAMDTGYPYDMNRDWLFSKARKELEGL